MTQASPRRRAKREKISHCHKRVRDVAQGIARGTYEMLMSANNEVYARWKKKYPELTAKQLEDKFVAQYWGSHIDGARATLARMLTEPLDPALKEEIVEILALDSTLMRGRRNPAVVMGQVGKQ